MAEYFVRSDGSAADKSGATSSDNASTSMNLAVLNSEFSSLAFSNGDIITLSSKGGNFTTNLFITQGGGIGSEIVIRGEEDNIPVWSATSIYIRASNLILRDIQSISPSASSFEFGEAPAAVYTNITTYSLKSTNSGNQNFQHLGLCEVTHNDIHGEGNLDEAISTHESPTVVINTGTFKSSANACYNWIDTPNITFNDCTFEALSATTKTLQVSGAGTHVYNRCKFIEHVDQNSRVLDWSITGVDVRFRNCKFFNLTDADFYILFRTALTYGEIINCTFIGDGVNSTTAIFNQDTNTKYINNYFIDVITNAFWSASTGQIDYNGFHNSGIAQGTNTTTGDPNFDSNGDIQNDSSTAFEAGIGPGLNADVPTDDFYGNTRSGNECDLGANEFTPVSPGGGNVFVPNFKGNLVGNFASLMMILFFKNKGK